MDGKQLRFSLTCYLQSLRASVSSMKPGLSSPCRIFSVDGPSLLSEAHATYTLITNCRGPIKLMRGRCLFSVSGLEAHLTNQAIASIPIDANPISPPPAIAPTRKQQVANKAGSGAFRRGRSSHATRAASWLPGEAPRQRVSSRNIAQQRISSRRATATMAIFLRAGLPR